ncbi:RsiV family protein [Paenibacillus sp. Mc5Re-14]|uniref:RsiV family protein n=1 Tax=Paenibacillus sp. Mc5Re-14 TaxID=1030529 RepID=UPI000B84A534
MFLNNVVKTNKQAFHLFEGIEFALQANKNVFAEKTRNFPLINKSNFYFYNEGIGVIFNPYEIGSYVAGFIEVKVPYSKIQSESGMFLDINKNFAADCNMANYLALII